MTGAAAGLMTAQACDAAFAIELMPIPNRIVVEKQNLGDLGAAQPIVQQQNGVRPSRQPMQHRPGLHQGDQGGALRRWKEAGTNHVPSRIHPERFRNRFFAISMSRGIPLPFTNAQAPLNSACQPARPASLIAPSGYTK